MVYNLTGLINWTKNKFLMSFYSILLNPLFETNNPGLTKMVVPKLISSRNQFYLTFPVTIQLYCITCFLSWLGLKNMKNCSRSITWKWFGRVVKEFTKYESKTTMKWKKIYQNTSLSIGKREEQSYSIRMRYFTFR